MHYASLPNFEEREEDFRAESVLLRRRFTDEGDAPGAPLLTFCKLSDPGTHPDGALENSRNSSSFSFQMKNP